MTKVRCVWAPLRGCQCIHTCLRARCRERPHVQLQYAFNGWELKNEDDAPFSAAMAPAGTPITETSDFWSTRFKVGIGRACGGGRACMGGSLAWHVCVGGDEVLP